MEGKPVFSAREFVAAKCVIRPQIHLKTIFQVQTADTAEDETCMTFVFHGEDHTLGNSLRYMLMKNPEISFCGYNIPHPSENKINLRIQTHGVPATDVLKKGLTDLSNVCYHILDTFQASVQEYKEDKADGDDDIDMDSSDIDEDDEED